MKRTFFMVIALLACVMVVGQELTLEQINIRDPYILPVEKEGLYYMYASSSTKVEGKAFGGMVAYTSRDLVKWTKAVRVFDVPQDNHLTGQVWAPEVHRYRGRYYLFATMNSDVRWKHSPQGGVGYTHRATQIFHARRPSGPFVPFDDKLPATPMGEMALDGTLWVEDGVPYMVYCHEWVETRDGEMKLRRLKRDLSGPEGEAVRLFCASAAPWSTGNGEGEKATFVTDGCFLHRTQQGGLLMLWSSFYKGTYAVGVAHSRTGRITGPWEQEEKPLYVGGGHSMLFRDFEGRLRMVLHAPNSPGGAERAKILTLEEVGDGLKVVE